MLKWFMYCMLLVFSLSSFKYFHVDYCWWCSFLSLGKKKKKSQPIPRGSRRDANGAEYLNTYLNIAFTPPPFWYPNVPRPALPPSRLSSSFYVFLDSEQPSESFREIVWHKHVSQILGSRLKNSNIEDNAKIFEHLFSAGIKIKREHVRKTGRFFSLARLFSQSK